MELMWSRRYFLTMPAALAVNRRAVQAQETFRSGVSLVLAPATVTDRSGKFIRGITGQQFTLWDNGVQRPVSVEEDPQAVALVLAIHASFDARKPLDRMRKAVNLFGPLVIGENGTVSLVAFRDEAQTVVPMTSAFESVRTAVRDLVAQGSGCSLVDAVKLSAEMLQTAPSDRRKVIVIMTEDRDRSSKADLRDTLILLQKQNITVYPLTYSPALMELGREVPTGPCRYVSAPVWRDPNFANAFRSMSNQGKVSDVLAAATGGRPKSFFRQSTTESLVAEIGEELHTQYLLSFAPAFSPVNDGFHSIRAAVADRAELNVRTRAGYWLTTNQ